MYMLCMQQRGIERGTEANGFVQLASLRAITTRRTSV